MELRSQTAPPWRTYVSKTLMAGTAQPTIHLHMWIEGIHSPGLRDDSGACGKTQDGGEGEQLAHDSKLTEDSSVGNRRRMWCASIQPESIATEWHAHQAPRGPSPQLSLRLTPKTRYGLALLSRANRMCLGQVVEDALESCFYAEGPGTLERRPAGGRERVRVLDVTWDERPWVRLANLAHLMPELLSRDEVELWGKLQEQPQYRAHGVAPTHPVKAADSMNHDAIAAHWSDLTDLYEVGI